MKIIVFDFDGVLIDTTGVKEQAYWSTAENFSIGSGDFLLSVLNQELAGCERRKVATWFAQKYSADPEAFVTIFTSKVDEGLAKLALAPATIQLLKEIESLHLPQYIVSAAPKNEILRILKKTPEISNIFLDIFGNEDGTKADIISSILEKHSIKDPSELLFAGDMTSDLNAALKCQVQFFRVESEGGKKCNWPEDFRRGHAVTKILNYHSETL